MFKEEGKNIWIFPDGELPQPSKDKGLPEAHEALIVLNTSNNNANLGLTFYFEDVEPIENVNITVKARRVKCIRIDHPEEIGGNVIPFNKQYALRVKSDHKIVATFGRLDTK